jgi:peptidoglycan/xylan/chitin deacetylase (PgdA/CDA1 family)
VLREPDPLVSGEVTLDFFCAHARFIASSYSVLPLPDAVALLAADRLPRNVACITFDDGYASNVDVALPVLERLKLKASFFICTGAIDGGRMWNDTVIEAVRRAPQGTLDLGHFGLGAYAVGDTATRGALLDRLLGDLKYLDDERRAAVAADLAAQSGLEAQSALMMSSEQVLLLHRRGMDIGGHTVNHPILARIAPETAQAEILAGMRRLRDITGGLPRSFAYPNGRPNLDYGAEHTAMVRAAGFELAVSTAFGLADHSSDRFQLPRVMTWNQTPLRFAAHCMSAFRATPDYV